MSKIKQSDSVIVQVDEATKGIMESITAGLTSEISEPLLKVVSSVNNISDSTEELLKQTRSSSNISVQIKKQSADIVEKADGIHYEIKQLSESVTALRKEQKALCDSVADIAKKLDNLSDIVGNIGTAQQTTETDRKNSKNRSKTRGKS